MNSLWGKIPQGRVKFKVGDVVRITKQKVKFAKGYEQTFSTEIFRGAKAICPKLSTNWQTSKIVLSKDSFKIMSLSMSLLHPRQFEKDKIERTLNKNGVEWPTVIHSVDIQE